MGHCLPLYLLTVVLRATSWVPPLTSAPCTERPDPPFMLRMPAFVMQPTRHLSSHTKAPSITAAVRRPPRKRPGLCSAETVWLRSSSA